MVRLILSFEPRDIWSITELILLVHAGRYSSQDCRLPLDKINDSGLGPEHRTKLRNSRAEDFVQT